MSGNTAQKQAAIDTVNNASAGKDRLPVAVETAASAELPKPTETNGSGSMPEINKKQMQERYFGSHEKLGTKMNMPNNLFDAAIQEAEQCSNPEQYCKSLVHLSEQLTYVKDTSSANIVRAHVMRNMQYVPYAARGGLHSKMATQQGDIMKIVENARLSLSGADKANVLGQAAVDLLKQDGPMAAEQAKALLKEANQTIKKTWSAEKLSDGPRLRLSKALIQKNIHRHAAGEQIKGFEGREMQQIAVSDLDFIEQISSLQGGVYAEDIQIAAAYAYTDMGQYEKAHLTAASIENRKSRAWTQEEVAERVVASDAPESEKITAVKQLWETAQNFSEDNYSVFGLEIARDGDTAARAASLKTKCVSLFADAGMSNEDLLSRLESAKIDALAGERGFWGISLRQARHGDIDAARETISHVESPWTNMYARMELAEEAHSAGFKAEAKQILDDIKDNLSDFPQQYVEHPWGEVAGHHIILI